VDLRPRERRRGPLPPPAPPAPQLVELHVLLVAPPGRDHVTARPRILVISPPLEMRALRRRLASCAGEPNPCAQRPACEKLAFAERLLECTPGAGNCPADGCQWRPGTDDLSYPSYPRHPSQCPTLRVPFSRWPSVLCPLLSFGTSTLSSFTLPRSHAPTLFPSSTPKTLLFFPRLAWVRLVRPVRPVRRVTSEPPFPLPHAPTLSRLPPRTRKPNIDNREPFFSAPASPGPSEYSPDRIGVRKRHLGSAPPQRTPNGRLVWPLASCDPKPAPTRSIRGKE